MRSTGSRRRCTVLSVVGAIAIGGVPLAPLFYTAGYMGYTVGHLRYTANH
jgi:hypothetical protein